MSARRRLLAPLAAAALLALTACSSGTAPAPPSDPPVTERARTPVTVPGSGPAGDHTDVRGVFAGPDGTTLVVLAGADATAGDDSAPGAALAVVGSDGTTVQASAELAPGSSPDTAFGRQGRAVVAGLVWPGTGPIGYDLQVLDPDTGTPGALLPVAVPADVSLTGSAAALGPDGVLYVAVSRGGGAPVLLAVDPDTGDVRASAEVAVDPGASPAEVVDLAVAPDGSRVVLTVTAPGAEQFAPSRTLLVTVGPDLAPLRAPVDLAPGFVRSLAVDAVVAGDGTAYAVVRGADADRVDREHVVAVGPDATAPEVLTADGTFAGTPVTEVALDGTTLWVTLQRETAAASVLAVDPRTGEAGTPLELCDELVGRLLAGDSGTLAVAARCDGEAVLWWLDPR